MCCFCSLTVIYNGDPVQGATMLQPLFNVVQVCACAMRRRPLLLASLVHLVFGMQPSFVDLHNFTMAQWEEYNANFTSVDQRQSYIKSGFIPFGGLTDEVIDIIETFVVSVLLSFATSASVQLLT